MEVIAKCYFGGKTEGHPIKITLEKQAGLVLITTPSRALEKKAVNVEASKTQIRIGVHGYGNLIIQKDSVSKSQLSTILN